MHGPFPVPKLLVVLLMLVLSAPARPQPALPHRFAADFELEAFGALIGRSTWRLAPAGDAARSSEENERYVWEARSETAGIAALIRDVTITERSEWEYHGESVRPIVYRYDRVGGNEPRKAEIRFDWENGFARNTVEGETWRMPIPEGTLDKIAYLLELMRDLAAGERDIRYNIADGGRLKVYDMREAGTEQIDTGIGRLETLKVRRHREGERETVIWCAPALHFLPVKVQHREKDGTVVTMQIRELRGMGLPPGEHRETERQRRATER